jgi:hypothetical protein
MSKVVIKGTIDEFDHNPILVNINKLKPYRFIKDKALQHVLIKPSDLVVGEHVQTKELEPLPVEYEDLQPTKFESINNYLTHGNIIGIDVHVHHYHDVSIEDNNVIVHNDQNDPFNETLINVYIEV